MSTEALSALLRDLEARFMDAASRRDPARVAGLLTEDFVEYGSSGRVYSRDEVLAYMRDTRPPHFAVEDFSVRVLAPACALATYRVLIDGDPSLRSSIWVERGGSWRMAFHQGTALPPR